MTIQEVGTDKNKFGKVVTMSDNNKNILRYVGDDGEFYDLIDDYFEGDSIDDEYLVEPISPYAIRALLQVYWMRFVDYHAFLQNLPARKVDELTLFAMGVRSLKRPIHAVSGALVMLFVVGPMVLATLFVMSRSLVDSDLPSDETILESHRETILATSGQVNIENLMHCEATILIHLDSVPLYTVDNEDVQFTRNLPIKYDYPLQVYRLAGEDDWYQWSYYTPEIGENIVLASYFEKIVCE